MDTNELADLDRIFFSATDESDEHAADSCCLSMAASSEVDRWGQCLDEYMETMRVLVAHTSGTSCDDTERIGWRFARPLVFTAHHTCELVLKKSIVSWKDASTTMKFEHKLGSLLDQERQVSNRQCVHAAWENDLMSLLAHAYEAGRYPFNKKSAALFDEWCCVSAANLGRAVTQFVQLVETGPWVVSP
ncbi:hypothetical protein [Nocardia higoensis]|uniref:hypothetical protein n=1 Tax=Nocardia higoensis TaxID=228599 RepID=UPI000593F524|nr:hypothetical protein [Nocardia higoensis]